MLRSIITASRQMNVLQKKQENSSANIANINTYGYKFEKIIQATISSKELYNNAGGENSDEKQQLGTISFGTKIDEVYRQFSQGIVTQTNNNTDIALTGPGFFAVRLENGEIGFTRNGNLQLNENNELVTMEGLNVLGINGNGDIVNVTCNDDFSINENGQISGEDVTIIIADFNDYQSLDSIGNSIFINSDEQQYNLSNSKIKQGFVELSNVDTLDEMVKMIEIAREFESNQRVIQTSNDTLQKAVNEIGRI